VAAAINRDRGGELPLGGGNSSRPTDSFRYPRSSTIMQMCTKYTLKFCLDKGRKSTNFKKSAIPKLELLKKIDNKGS